MARTLAGILQSLLVDWPLLLLFWGVMEAPFSAQNELAVHAPTEIHGRLGTTVKLPCTLQSPKPYSTTVTQITWIRWEPSGESSIVAIFHPLHGLRILELQGCVDFKATWQDKDRLEAKLTVCRLRPQDEANYTCEITTFPWGTGRAHTWLRVFYAPQVSISRSDDTGQQGHSLTCYAHSNPKHSGYEWSTSAGPLPPSAKPQGPWLLLQPSEESINTTFICRVFNDLGMGQAAMRVMLPGSSRNQSWLILAYTIVLPFVLIAIAVGIRALTDSRCFRKIRDRLLTTQTEQIQSSQEPLTSIHNDRTRH